MSLDLLDDEKHHQKPKRLLQTRHRDQQETEGHADKCADKRYDRHTANDHRDAACVRKPSDQQGDEEHHAKDHSLQALSGQESREGPIRQARDVADLICPRFF